MNDVAVEAALFYFDFPNSQSYKYEPSFCILNNKSLIMELLGSHQADTFGKTTYPSSPAPDSQNPFPFAHTA